MIGSVILVTVLAIVTLIVLILLGCFFVNNSSAGIGSEVNIVVILLGVLLTFGMYESSRSLGEKMYKEDIENGKYNIELDGVRSDSTQLYKLTKIK